MDSAGAFIGSMAGGVADAALLNNLSNAFSMVTYKHGPLRMAIYAIMCTNRIFYLILTHWIIKNNSAAMSKAKFIGWLAMSRTLYRKTVLSTTGITDVPSVMANIIQETPSGETVGILPFYWDKTANQTVTVYHARMFHDPHMEDLKQQATIKAGVLNKSGTTFSKLVAAGAKVCYNTLHPQTAYASSQVKRVGDRIQSIVEAETLCKCYEVHCINVDSEPGLGKTWIAHYVVNHGLVKRVLYINLWSDGMWDLSFRDIMLTAFFNLNMDVPTLVVIDEPDKYFTKYIGGAYARHISSAAAAKTKVLSVEEFVTVERTNMLTSINNMIDRTGITASCIILILSNNFESMYEGINMKHYKSLKNRIEKHEFTRCVYHDVVGFLQFKRQHFVSSATLYIDDAQMDKVIETLDRNVLIPYRKMARYFSKAGYSFQKTVDLINSYYHKKHPVVQELVDLAPTVVPVAVATTVVAAVVSTPTSAVVAAPKVETSICETTESVVQAPTVMNTVAPKKITQKKKVKTVPAQESTPDQEQTPMGTTYSYYLREPFIDKNYGRPDVIIASIYHHESSALKSTALTLADPGTRTEGKCQIEQLLAYGKQIAEDNDCKIISYSDNRICDNKACDWFGSYSLCRKCSNQFECKSDGTELCEISVLEDARTRDDYLVCNAKTVGGRDDEEVGWVQMCRECMDQYTSRYKNKCHTSTCAMEGTVKYRTKDGDIYYCSVCNDSEYGVDYQCCFFELGAKDHNTIHCDFIDKEGYVSTDTYCGYCREHFDLLYPGSPHDDDTAYPYLPLNNVLTTKELESVKPFFQVLRDICGLGGPHTHTVASVMEMVKNLNHGVLRSDPNVKHMVTILSTPSLLDPAITNVHTTCYVILERMDRYKSYLDTY